jgi:hypothetical protein
MAFVCTDLVNEPIEYRHEVEVFGFAVRHEPGACQFMPVRHGTCDVRIAQAHDSTLPFSLVVFPMGQYRANIHPAPIAVNRNDQAGLVSARVQSISCTHVEVNTPQAATSPW